MLNNEQQKVASTLKGYLLVNANPGSGKTETMTQRYVNILKSGVEPQRIFFTTFTNKAAEEMLERIKKHTDTDLSKHWIGTFHKLCGRILRGHINKISSLTPQYCIISANDQETLIDRLKSGALSDYKAADLVQQISSTYKAAGLLPADVLDRDDLWGLYDKYQKELTRSNLVDFDDILLYTLKLLQDNQAVRAWACNVFEYVMVDEGQDTNRVQFDIVDLISQQHKNLCVTGDSAQSLYSWRGADPLLFIDFPKKYPEAQVITLEVNYRSYPGIVELANKVERNNITRIDKTSIAWRTDQRGEPEIVSFFDGYEEARWVVSKVKRAKAQGYDYKDMAILLRTRAIFPLFEQALIAEGVPVQVLQGTSFFDRIEIKDLLAYLNLIENPNNVVALARIASIHKIGIGVASLTKMEAALKSFDIRYGHPVGAYTILNDNPESSIGLSEKAKQGLVVLFNKIEQIRSTLNLDTIIEQILKTFDYRAVVNKTDNPVARTENIERLRTLVSMQIQNGCKTLGELLEYVMLISDQDNITKQNSVKLMTVHAAKGLEYPVVFMPGVCEGFLPHGRTENIEEERRIFYVAATRARDRLHISYSQEYDLFGKTIETEASRFVKEAEEYIDDYPTKPQTTYSVMTFKGVK